jgi:5-methylcytosine-specific restriction endonuclease McrA
MPPWIKRNKAHDNWSGSPFYVSKAWRKLRAYHISMYPLCVECLKEKKLTDCSAKGAGVVDHIQPIRLGGEALDVGNLQTLCNKHHAAKTARERTGK